jgi:hypothetical protein
MLLVRKRTHARTHADPHKTHEQTHRHTAHTHTSQYFKVADAIFSMTFSSSSSSTTANTVTSSSGPSRLSLPRGQHDDHRDRPTSSRPGSSESGASRRLRRRPCRNQPVVFVDDDEKIPEPNVLRTRKTFCSNSWLHWLRCCRLLRPSLMCSAVKCRQSAERLQRRRSMSATHQRSGGVHAAAGIMSTPTLHS